MGFAERMDDVADRVEEVLRLCRALRDADGLLGLSDLQQVELLALVTRAEQAAAGTDPAGMDAPIRAIRYLLVEAADGPIAAFMSDAAARIAGDDIGRLFS
jgi:hypothetical protein